MGLYELQRVNELQTISMLESCISSCPVVPLSVVIPVHLHCVQLLTHIIGKEGDLCFTEMGMSCKTIFKKTKHYSLNMRKLKKFI